MGEIQPTRPALLLFSAFSRYPAALEWAVQRAVKNYGAIGLQSEKFSFTETDYYDESMGVDLLKMFFVFDRPFDLGTLPTIKNETNRWEQEYREQAGHAEARPLNLDPGYISESKLVLASTKDHSHRIYLNDGIYAEITLHFHHKSWQPLPWTYPDYRRTDFQEFFARCRSHLRQLRLEDA